ncbi:MAG: hypothetical protein ACOYK7_08820, partial [Pirellulales bacterium]
MEPYLSQILSRLAAGTSRHRNLDAASRARLALETARSTAAAAADWVALAVETKHGAIDGGAAAEETATGPLATLRILLITARCLVEVAREGKPRPCGSGTRFGLSAGGRALVGI